MPPFKNPDHYDDCGHCGDEVYIRHAYKTDSDHHLCHLCIHKADKCHICGAYEVLEEATDGSKWCGDCVGEAMEDAA